MLPSCGIRAGLAWAVWQLSCELDGPEFKSQYKKKDDSFFPQRPNRLWVPPSLLFNWCGYSFLEVKLQSREVNHSPPFGAEIKNEWSYTSIAPIWRSGVNRLWCTNLKIRATIAKRQLITENVSATSYHHGLKSFFKNDSCVSSTGHEKQRFIIMSKTKAMDNVLKQKYLIHAIISDLFNPLNPELNPICYLLALLGAHHFLHVSRIRVKLLTFRLLMSYIYGTLILDVSRSHTTTQHSR